MGILTSEQLGTDLPPNDQSAMASMDTAPGTALNELGHGTADAVVHSINGI